MTDADIIADTMKPAYYNEIDSYCAQWLRNLIIAGLIPDGEVDQRDIREVQPSDIEHFGQVHFFAGIGGWPYAFRLAGWPDDRPVWSASCPCPPFSSAGKRQICPECKSPLLVWCPRRTGFAICAACDHAWLADARHLWPEVWRLAAERRPQRIYGEQVASVGGLEWLAGVRGSLEILGYAIGAPDLPSCSIGAPHIRPRIFWMADAHGRDAGAEGIQRGGKHGQLAANERISDDRMADPPNADKRSGEHRQETRIGSDGKRRRRSFERGEAGGMGDTSGAGSSPSEREAVQRKERRQIQGRTAIESSRSFWADPEIVECVDGKNRRVKSGLPVLADGLPTALDGLGPVSRVGTISGFGNAINPILAAEFIVRTEPRYD